MSNKWLDWFAWYPVRLETGEIAFLKTVRRRGIYNPGGCKGISESPWVWLYRKRQ